MPHLYGSGEDNKGFKYEPHMKSIAFDTDKYSEEIIDQNGEKKLIYKDYDDPLIKVIPLSQKMNSKDHGVRIVNLTLKDELVKYGKINKKSEEYISAVHNWKKFLTYQWKFSEMNMKISRDTEIELLGFKLTGGYSNSQMLTFKASVRYIYYKESKVTDLEDPYDLSGIPSISDEDIKIPKLIKEKKENIEKEIDIKLNENDDIGDL